MKSLLRRNVTVLLGFVVLLFFVSSYAHALTISPARVEISGDPGQTLRGKYLLINEQNEPKTFYSSFENFEAQGETGAPNFVAANEGLGTWIASDRTVTLGPNESRELIYTIKIPENAEPGGNFAAIFWGTTDPRQAKGDKQVMIGAKIGVLILLRVNGDIEEGGGVIAFNTVRADQFDAVEGDSALASAIGSGSGQRFFSMLPVEFEYRFQNTGADRIKPEGDIRIKNTLGLTTSVLNANPHAGNVLPQSTRKYAVVWNGVDDTKGKPEDRLEPPKGFFKTVVYQARHFAFGLYTAEIALAYGASGELTDSESFMFFVLPWQLLIVVAIGLLILWQGLKRYNRMIVKRAQKVSAK